MGWDLGFKTGALDSHVLQLLPPPYGLRFLRHLQTGLNRHHRLIMLQKGSPYWHYTTLRYS